MNDTVKKRLITFMPDEDHCRVKQLAVASDRSTSQTISVLVRIALDLPDVAQRLGVVQG